MEPSVNSPNQLFVALPRQLRTLFVLLLSCLATSAFCQVSTGGIAGWGLQSIDQGSNSAAPIVQIAGGANSTVALRKDATVVCWGNNAHGQGAVPAGLIGVSQVAAGDAFTVALKSNGTVVCWGDNILGQSTPPSGLSGVTQVAAGGSHGIALKSNGTVVCWGDNGMGECTVPAGLTGVVQVAAGILHTVALKSMAS